MYELLLGAWLGPSIKRGTAIAIAAFCVVLFGVMMAIWSLGGGAETAVLVGLLAGILASLAAPRIFARQ